MLTQQSGYIPKITSEKAQFIFATSML